MSHDVHNTRASYRGEVRMRHELSEPPQLTAAATPGGFVMISHDLMRHRGVYAEVRMALADKVLVMLDVASEQGA